MVTVEAAVVVQVMDTWEPAANVPPRGAVMSKGAFWRLSGKVRCDSILTRLWTKYIQVGVFNHNIKRGSAVSRLIAPRLGVLSRMSPMVKEHADGSAFDSRKCEWPDHQNASFLSAALRDWRASFFKLSQYLGSK
jgi:hypothetical protein